MLGINWQQKLQQQKPLKQLFILLLVMVLGWSVTSCGKSADQSVNAVVSKATRGKLAEVSPPFVIQELKQTLEVYQPQVKVVSPRPEQVLDNTTVEVKLQVSDLPLYKDEAFDLGPYLQVVLDNQPYAQVYDTQTPLILEGLTPGTHTLRVFAARPWHESFKNDGAFAQTVFHVFARTGENQPDAAAPLLTYNSPQGTLGAEPVLLDFYLTNAPLHLVAREDTEDAIPDWQIRCTINGESFTFDRWEPIYLKGLKPGRNWVQLELLNEKGDPLPNVFNNSVQLITYEPGGTDPLALLTRGELTADAARRIVDPNYVPPAPEVVEPEKPEFVEPEPIEPTEPEPTAPELTAPELVAPGLIAPGLIAPERAVPKLVEPEPVKPEPIKPSSPDLSTAKTAEPKRVAPEPPLDLKAPSERLDESAATKELEAKAPKLQKAPEAIRQPEVKEPENTEELKEDLKEELKPVPIPPILVAPEGIAPEPSPVESTRPKPFAGFRKAVQETKEAIQEVQSPLPDLPEAKPTQVQGLPQPALMVPPAILPAVETSKDQPAAKPAVQPENPFRTIIAPEGDSAPVEVRTLPVDPDSTATPPSPATSELSPTVQDSLESIKNRLKGIFQPQPSSSGALEPSPEERPSGLKILESPQPALELPTNSLLKTVPETLETLNNSVENSVLEGLTAPLLAPAFPEPAVPLPSNPAAAPEIPDMMGALDRVKGFFENLRQQPAKDSGRSLLAPLLEPTETPDLSLPSAVEQAVEQAEQAVEQAVEQAKDAIKQLQDSDTLSPRPLPEIFQGE